MLTKKITICYLCWITFLLSTFLWLQGTQNIPIGKGQLFRLKEKKFSQEELGERVQNPPLFWILEDLLDRVKNKTLKTTRYNKMLRAVQNFVKGEKSVLVDWFSEQNESEKETTLIKEYGFMIFTDPANYTRAHYIAFKVKGKQKIEHLLWIPDDYRSGQTYAFSGNKELLLKGSMAKKMDYVHLMLQFFRYKNSALSLKQEDVYVQIEDRSGEGKHWFLRISPQHIWEKIDHLPIFDNKRKIEKIERNGTTLTRNNPYCSFIMSNLRKEKIVKRVILSLAKLDRAHFPSWFVDMIARGDLVTLIHDQLPLPSLLEGDAFLREIKEKKIKAKAPPLFLSNFGYKKIISYRGGIENFINNNLNCTYQRIVFQGLESDFWYYRMRLNYSFRYIKKGNNKDKNQGKESIAVMLIPRLFFSEFSFLEGENGAIKPLLDVEKNKKFTTIFLDMIADFVLEKDKKENKKRHYYGPGGWDKEDIVAYLNNRKFYLVEMGKKFHLKNSEKRSKAFDLLEKKICKKIPKVQKKLVKEEEKKEEEKKIEENENVLKSLKSISTKGEEVDEWESSKWLVSSLVDPSSKKNKEEGSALDGEKIKIPKKRGRLKKRQGNIFTKTLIGAGVLSSATLLYRQKKSDKRKEGEEGNLEEDAELMEDFFS